MGLKEYHAKRSFTETPEPKGKARTSGRKLRFVVQKHAATRLHYDFRLELGGVLVSWAIPKGPSLNPDDKRLAMQVEDHPFDYRRFEGVIPDGQYGAGPVMVWDEGWYEPYEPYTAKDQEKVLRHGIHRGDLKVVLHGKKLRGAWAIVRAKGFGENSWLMIKKQDDGVSTQDVTEQDRSVKTGKSMSEISGIPEVDVSDAPKGRFPKSVKPMLATLVKEPFDRRGWLFEIKWDGYRAISSVQDRAATLTSRNGQDFTERYAPIAEELSALGHDAVLDGEVVVVDGRGRSRFQLLQRYHRTGKGNLQYYVFDILHLDGHNLTKLPLTRRKEILAELIPNGKRIHISDHVEDKGEAFFAAAKRQDLEGIMAKDGSSPYLLGTRSPAWEKVKTGHGQEVVIAGFTAPRGSRKRFGALVLGVYDHGELRHIGQVGTGFDDASLEAIYRKLKPLVRASSSFERPPKAAEPITWVKPELVAEVAFTEWTDEGHLRHPTFLGLREDKPAEDVVREAPHVPSPAEAQVRIDGHPVRLTHQQKVYWPADGITKGDLIDYYRSVAKVILPYLKGRPESLNRFPHGIEGDSFYQKDVDHQPPRWVKTKAIHSDSGDKDIHWLICDNEATLVYLANLGCIELNPWHSQVGSLAKPDYLLLDLDAKTTRFGDIITVGQTVRDVLADLKLPSVPKTSGKTGLHVCLPLGGRYSYDQSKQFAEILMRLVHVRLPKLTSLERNPEKRKGAVYLDFLQNRKGQTMAAPYCVRPVPGATVSTPLDWKEIRKGLDPKKFTIKTTAARLKRKGDLWKPVLGKGIDLPAALKRLERLRPG